MLIAIDKQAALPAYLQLTNLLKQAIADGEFMPGEQLPSVRELIELSQLSHATVVRALRELTRDGTAISAKGKGHFVPSGQAPARKPPRALRIVILYACDVLFPDAFYTPFSHEVALGISKAAAQRGHRLSFEHIEAYAKRRETEPADGAIIMNGNNLKGWEPLVGELREPVVAVRPVASFPAVSTVDSDEFSPTREAVAHLIQGGHTRIAMLTADNSLVRHAQTLAVARQQLARHGLELRPEYDFPSTIDHEGGREAGVRLLALPEPPTAILCGSDTPAMGVIEVAKAKGLRIPEDLSVVGKLDFQIFAGLHPRLTSIAVPMKQMGWQALVDLEQLIAGQATAPTLKMFHSTFVLRETTGPAEASCLLTRTVSP